MKRWLTGLLMLLVLTGCSQSPDSTTATTDLPPTTPPTGLYDPDSTLESHTGGAVRAFPLGTDGYVGVRTMADRLLVLSLDTNGALELKVLTGNTGIVEASAVLEGVRADSVRTSSDRIACYSVTENCIILLDASLHVIDRISMPNGIEGDVCIDEALAVAYFCTPGQIRAIDLTTEVPRLVHQHECLQQSLHNVIFNGKVLVCKVESAEGGYYEFIDSATGKTLGKDTTTWQINAWSDRYFLRRTDGAVQENLFGLVDEQPRQLNINAVLLYGLPQINAAIEVSDTDIGIALCLYDLQTGLIQSQLTLPELHAVYSLCADPTNGSVWFIYEDSDLCQDILCHWDTTGSGSPDKTVYTGPRYTASAPDTEGLARCTQQAAILNEKYGIRIVFDSTIKPSAEYTLTPEFQVSLIEQALKDLETCLASVPENFIKTLSKVSDTPLSVALVRNIRSVTGHGPSDGTGLQYWSGGDACIALCVTDTFQQDFYHQLFHVLEVYLYSESSELDLWDKLNPKGFSYDHSYTGYTQHTDSKHLQGDTRAFIDAYSMTFAREDRARIFEYAMLDNSGELFSSDAMQKKLHQLSYCIRDAFGWRRSELTYPWEQYLEKSLAYTKRK